MYLKIQNLFFTILIICLFNAGANAQFGIQVNTGLMNYGGDLQRSPFTFKESRLTAGGSLLYSFHNFVLRGSLTAGGIQADDAKTKVYAARNLSFKSSIKEISGCLEYDIKLHEESKFIPYIFAGIGYFHFNPYTYYNSKKVYLQPLGTEGQGLSIYPNKKPYSLTQHNFPLGLGVKYKLSDNWLVGLEFNTRLIFTDYLDDVSNKYPDEKTLFKERGQLAVDLSFRGNEVDPAATFPSSSKLRGNPKQNDNFYTSVVTLTYMFPEPGFNSASGHGRHAASINCPKKVH